MPAPGTHASSVLSRLACVVVGCGVLFQVFAHLYAWAPAASTPAIELLEVQQHMEPNHITNLHPDLNLDPSSGPHLDGKQKPEQAKVGCFQAQPALIRYGLRLSLVHSPYGVVQNVILVRNWVPT